MTDYRRKPTPAKAWQYDRQPQAQWPEWVRNHRVNTNMGQQPIGAGAGVVLVPTKGGTTVNMVVGDFLVLEGDTHTDPVNGTIHGGTLTVLKPDAFEAQFETAEPVEVNQDPAPSAAPAPKSRAKTVEVEPAPAAEPPAAEEA